VSGPIEVNPGPVNFYRITKEPNGTLDELTADAVTIGDPLIYYANGFDTVGNFAGNQSVMWRGTKSLVPILKNGAADLVATNIVKSPKKVKDAVTGELTSDLTDIANVEIHDPGNPGTPLAVLPVTLSPGPA